MLGTCSMLLSSLCVAIAGILVEKMLRPSQMQGMSPTPTVGFMVRNAQLAWYSWLTATLLRLWRSWSGLSPASVFQGFTMLVWSSTLLQATGGFIVSWCVVLTSTVMKNHAQVIGFLIASIEPLLSQRHINLQVSKF
jgi:UDP-sugar transporter A1/2/3